MTTERPTLVLATRNAKKAREMARLMESGGFRVIDLSQFPHAPEVEESGETFAENARLKASETARAIGRWTVADDSGLMVDALGGAPGVRSARFAGEGAADPQNNEKLLRLLAEVPDSQRGAQFVCHMAVADPSGTIRFEAAGRCSGYIAHHLRGEGGFGYDPLFLVPEYGRSFGELGPAVKACISHRGQAVRNLLRQLRRMPVGIFA